MDNNLLFIVLPLVAVIVLLLMWMLQLRTRYREQISVLDAEVKHLQQSKVEAQEETQRRVAEMQEDAQRRVAEANGRVEEAKRDAQRLLEDERRSWQQQQTVVLEAVKGQLRQQYEQEMRERSQRLKEVNREQMDAVVGPLQNELKRLSELLARSQKDTVELRSAITAVHEHDKERDRTTQSLTEALKNRGKVHGDWGEMVLEDILRDSGLREHTEYEKQQSVRDESGKNLRPDVVVYTPDGGAVIIDSKVSVTAYADYVGAASDEEREKAYADNYQSVWNHVEELAAKHYERLVPNAIPEVLMFVPNEGSYVLAMNKDSGLAVKAYRKGVLIVNPTNLMVVLRLIVLTWQNSRQDKNVKDILDSARKIFEKYSTFAETFLKLGQQMETAQNTYEKAMGQLKNGRGNLGAQIDSLRSLGVTTSKQLPENLMPLDE